MRTVLIRIVSALLITAMVAMSAGCYGSFILTSKLYKWNGTVGSKIAQEAVFLVLVIVPVYGLATFADAVVLNLIEFWSGKNPMASNDVIMIDGVPVRLAFDPSQKSFQIIRGEEGKGSTLTFKDEQGIAVAKDEHGTILASCRMTGDGGMMLSDKDGKLLGKYSKKEVEQLFAAASGLQ